MISKYKKELAEKILRHRKQIVEWQDMQAKLAPPPFYCSIDLRDAGYKIAPVDSNLYPAGFNNICPEDMRSAPAILKRQIEKEFAKVGRTCPKQVLIIPEAHTTNLFYIENLYYLDSLVREAGFETRIGWYSQGGNDSPNTSNDPIPLKSQTGKDLIAYPIQINGGVISAAGFVPDAVLLNNDFSDGYPKELDSVTQPIVPSHSLGWHSRKKSDHFKHYNALAAEFAAIIDLDPWLLQIDTEAVGSVNFNEDQGIEEVATSVESVLKRTQDAYARYGVTRKPFVFVKNNSGTYGMGIMVVRSADELRSMNRRTKNKMSVGKNKTQIESVAVQEGIPTGTLVDRLAAEPVIYLVGGELIGGFLRTNQEKGDEENLNSSGMAFRKLCMTDLKMLDEDPDEASKTAHDSVLELVYGSIAQISALAAGRELAARPQTQLVTKAALTLV